MASVALAEHLAERRGEIERATLTRVHAIADPREVEDPAYGEGLREAVRAGVALGIAAAASPGPEDSLPGPVPAPLIAQARLAALCRVPLDTVLRRYFAGHALLADVIAAAGEQGAAAPAEVRRALRRETALLDRISAACAGEYEGALRGRRRDSGERRAERVRMLLRGELVEEAELGYELEGWHLGVVAAGPGVKVAAQELAGALGCQVLLVHAGGETIWGWFGSERGIDISRVRKLSERICPTQVCLALGDPGEGLEGWRLTHRQAQAAMRVARLDPSKRAAYADVALLALALTDETLAETLCDIYLRPLESEQDGGMALRQTLEAYFDSGRNASSAAAVLGLSRNTISVRLRSVEEKVGRPVDECAAELATALRLSGLSGA